ncbi:MAG: YdcF family protein [Anaerolineae bacterium]
MRRYGSNKAKTLLRLVGVPGLVALLAYAWALSRVYAFARADELSAGLRADVIVVLGAAQWNGVPSPVLRGRLDHAIALYHAGHTPIILFAGGSRPGDQFTEAKVGRDYALTRGVPEPATRLEQAGRTTWQSMVAVRRIMAAQGWTTAILVSDPFHMRRLKSMAGDLGILSYSSPTPFSAIRSKSWWYTLNEAHIYLGYELGYKP